MSAERRGPAICNVSNIGEGKDEMTKASIDLQDLKMRARHLRNPIVIDALRKTGFPE
jgi:hypothetical protein